MAEISINEYVRTKDGQIYKIEDGTEFYEDSVNVGIGIIPEVDGIWVDKEHFTYIDKRQIVKHSKNIIDLIEVDDYVISQDGIEGKVEFVMLPLKIFVDGEEVLNDDIKSIVTKEKFEAMEYKVKE